MGGERGGVEGARPRRARCRLEGDRDQAHADGSAHGHAPRTRRAARPRARPSRAAVGQHLAHPRPRRRGRRGSALTEPIPLDASVVRSVLRPLPPDASKEVRGRVLVVGGSHRYPGAILLAGRAAARSGAGVVTIAAGRSIVEMVAGQDPNLTFFPLAEVQPGLIATGAAAQLSTLLSDKIRALLVGPGLAHAAGTDEFVVAVLRNAKGATTVVDADGLNALARTEDWPSVLPPRTILTPHDGEAARLSGRVVPKDTARVAFAERQAAQWNVTLVLKGAVTVVTDGKRTYVHDAPNPTLSIGGSGDALGGAVAAFAARGLAPLAAAAAAVWVHGRAGALLAAEIGESGALATDIVDALPRALRQILTSPGERPTIARARSSATPQRLRVVRSPRRAARRPR
ncbi:MAG: NAD(P)H-hydrate dehydratase [Chloroflexi bacterium]|nr:MAG: NAD(P)H-hydrate dehydratase [Chloroflexota bacterium]